MDDDVVVKESKIEGKGVYAARDFKKGEVVMRWDTSNVLDEKEANEVPEHLKRYLSPYHGKFLLQKPPARYVNHSCDPNTKVVNECSDVAIRDIKKGEEITSDYSVYSIPGKVMECHCGAKNCKGRIEKKE